MPRQRIHRTHDSILLFDGELLAALDNRRSPAVENKRWHEIACYRIEEPINFAVLYRPAWILKISFLAATKAELPVEWADVYYLPAAIRQAIGDYEPAGALRGYPPGEKFAEANAKLAAVLTANYRELAAAFWARLEPLLG
jgi:hypothetical protein